MSESIALDESIDRAIMEALEGMAFTEVARIEDGGLDGLAEDALWARIDVVEPAVGELVLLTDEEFAGELEEAATGEVTSDPSMRLEVLGEILNTLAGGWARRLLAEGKPTALGIPKTGRGEWATGAEYEIAIYATEDDVRIVLALKR